MSDAKSRSSQEAGVEAAGAAPYRVLARKYRPAIFDDLIGQSAMVRTVSNAFETGRIPQAWILTGVRGVGKTTTARILARALNYQLPDDSISGPTINMPQLGVHCQAIMESRHIDVLEMDAASNRRIEDIRQINDAIRYAPANARYKVYILDEVHMLTPEAFNALLKTLEEPPPHAKFVFATTDINKVPITVLSRCQRFDLRRVETGELVSHLEKIAAKEDISVEPAALAMIARAAEGSVRDSLSLFDQAIAHAAGPVEADHVRQMLGLADRTRVVELFDALLRGDIAAALGELRDQYNSGADPAVILSDLAEFTHFVTRVKIVPAVADDLSLAEVERTRGREFAAALSMRVLSRVWQMLLKGITEVEAARRPVAAAEMVLVRIAYAADLPTPDEVIRSLGEGTPVTAGARPQGNGGSAVSHAPVSAAARADIRSDLPRGTPRAAAAVSPVMQAEPAPEMPVLAVGTLEELIALATEKRDLQIKTALERDIRLVHCEDGRLDIALEQGASKTLLNDLSRKLSAWTGRQWMVSISREPGAPTLKQQADMRDAELKRGVRGDPLVQAVLERFPGAEIVAVREPEQAAGDFIPEPPAETDDSENA